MIIQPTAWMQELPKEGNVELAVRTTTVKEVADDWESPIPLYTVEDLRVAVAAEREACAEIAEKQRFAMHISLTSHPPQNGTAVGIANEIRARGKA